jgi:hypothetical protein
MAKQTCGKTTVEVDARCAWTCGCFPNKGCDWIVSCPDGKGGWIYTSGVGDITAPPNDPTLTVAGNLAAIASCLAKMWKRKVTVPEQLAYKKVARTLKGTPEEIVHALGLKL